MVEIKELDVSLSFHYLVREKTNEDKTEEEIEITEAEFSEIASGLSTLKGITQQLMRGTLDEETIREFRLRHKVAIDRLDVSGPNFISGVYRNAYWGHSYENSEHGYVSAESLNLRPFFFQLYLAQNGRVFIASQYLGNYGGYEALKKTILSFMRHKSQIVVKSFNMSNAYIQHAIPIAVEIEYSKKSEHIAADNVYDSSRAIVFKSGPEGDGFAEAVRRDFLSLEGKDFKDVRKAVASFMSKRELHAVNDDDIAGCSVIAKVKKKEKVIHLLDRRNYATRFPVDVALNSEGHPEYDDIKDKAVDVLKNEILDHL